MHLADKYSADPDCEHAACSEKSSPVLLVQGQPEEMAGYCSGQRCYRDGEYDGSPGPAEVVAHGLDENGEGGGTQARGHQVEQQAEGYDAPAVEEGEPTR